MGFGRGLFLLPADSFIYYVIYKVKSMVAAPERDLVEKQNIFCCLASHYAKHIAD